MNTEAVQFFHFVGLFLKLAINLGLTALSIAILFVCIAEIFKFLVGKARDDGQEAFFCFLLGSGALAMFVTMVNVWKTW